MNIINNLVNMFQVKNKQEKDSLITILAVSIYADQLVREEELAKALVIIEKIYDGEDLEYMNNFLNDKIQAYSKSLNLWEKDKDDVIKFIKEGHRVDVLEIVLDIFKGDHQIHRGEQTIMDSLNTLQNELERRAKPRKGFTLIELIVTVAILGILALGVFQYVLGKKTEIQDSQAINDVLRQTHESLIDYQNTSYLSRNDFTGLTPTTAEAFFPANSFTIDTTNDLVVPTQLDEMSIKFVPAKNAGGTNNRNYKIMFDMSALKVSKGWSDQQTMKIENTIANFYKELSKLNKVGGSLAALGAANVPIVSSPPNSDGIVVVETK